MGWPQVPIVLVCLILGLTHITHAHSSPRDFLDAHNIARASVGVPPLVWDNKVAAYAQRYANVRSKDCDILHSLTRYGENLAVGSWEMSAKEAVEMWVDERFLYDVHANTCLGDDCLHYVQVVWKNSTRVGCGTARCHNGWTFVACNYDPPGNIIGERPY